jgi:hypothetical protein
MMTYGFSAAMLAGMASDDFVTVVVDTLRAGRRKVKIRWLQSKRVRPLTLQITDAGRKAIEG